MNRCQAILICKATSKDKRVGHACNAPALYKRCERQVCWLHRDAARPLQFDDMGTERQEQSA